MLEGCQDMVFEIIDVDPAEDSPLEITTRAALFESSQIIKLLVYTICTHQHMQRYRISALRQRAVEKVTEVLKMNEITYALNIHITSIIFIFHADDILSGKYVCSGIENAYLIRYEVNEENRRFTNNISPDSFMPFASSYGSAFF